MLNHHYNLLCPHFCCFHTPTASAAGAEVSAEACRWRRWASSKKVIVEHCLQSHPRILKNILYIYIHISDLLKWLDPRINLGLGENSHTKRLRLFSLAPKIWSLWQSFPYKWWFRKIGTQSHHPFLDGIFHEINHPCGVPPWPWKPTSRGTGGRRSLRDPPAAGEWGGPGVFGVFGAMWVDKWEFSINGGTPKMVGL